MIGRLSFYVAVDSRITRVAVRGIGASIRRGFTLIEALMASGILLAVVVSVTAAISAGQQNSYEAHQKIAGALAAEEMLGRVVSDSYANLPHWNGHVEAVGHMTDMKGQPMSSTFAMIGRRVSVSTSLITLNTTLDVKVRGTTVRVIAFDAAGRTLSDVSRFVAEPQS